MSVATSSLEQVVRNEPLVKINVMVKKSIYLSLYRCKEDTSISGVTDRYTYELCNYLFLVLTTFSIMCYPRKVGVGKEDDV